MKPNYGILGNMKVQGFKSIKEMDLELRPLNIIIGPNGVGKSNFINVFEFLYNIINLNLQEYIKQNGGAERFLYLGSKNTKSINIEIKFKLNMYKATLKTAIPDTLLFEDENVSYKQDVTSLFNFNGEESKIKQFDKHRIVYTRDYLNGCRIYHFHDTSNSALIKKTASISDNVFLQANGENLSAILYRIKTNFKEEYEKIISVIKVVAPFFQDFILEPDDNGNIMLRWKQKGIDKVFDANYLSDGTLRFIALVTLLLQPKNMSSSIVLIDEPELGLHPYALKVLAEIMQVVAKNGNRLLLLRSL